MTTQQGVTIPTVREWIPVEFRFKPLNLGRQTALFHVQGEGEGNWVTIRETHDGFSHVNYELEAPRDLSRWTRPDGSSLPNFGSFAEALETALEIIAAS